MAQAPASQSVPSLFKSLLGMPPKIPQQRFKCRYKGVILVAAAVLLSPLIFAQNDPQVTGVDPNSGKVNDTVTISGASLGKGAVSAVFLSDDKDDFKAAIEDQSGEKIVVKVPQVKSGVYHVSIQVGDKILIKPLRFTVQE